MVTQATTAAPIVSAAKKAAPAKKVVVKKTVAKSTTSRVPTKKAVAAKTTATPVRKVVSKTATTAKTATPKTKIQARPEAAPVNMVQDIEISKRSTGAIEGKAEAVKSVLANKETQKSEKATGLKAILRGMAKDEIKALRRLLEDDAKAGKELLKINPDDELVENWRTGVYPYKNKMSRRSYEEQKFHLQVELLKLQNWAKETGQRVVILFEGRDAAGKGGTIKRFMEHLNPRGARVVALEKPSERERGEW